MANTISVGPRNANAVYTAETTGFAFETLTVDSTSGGVALTSATYEPSGASPAIGALVTVESNPARYRYDGGAPTTTVGHLLAAADKFYISGLAALRAFRAIRTTGSSATFQVTYER